MYLPHPAPSPPLADGIVASGETDLPNRATLDLGVRPVSGLSLHGRMFASDAFSDGDPERSRGGEGAVVFRQPLAAPSASGLRTVLEIGGAAGRDHITSQGVRGVTDRYSGHLGYVWATPERDVSLLARVTTVYTYNLVDSEDGTAAYGPDEGVFFEPIVRVNRREGQMEIGVQTGLSLFVGKPGPRSASDQGYRFTRIPMVSALRFGYHLGIVAPSPHIPPAVP